MGEYEDEYETLLEAIAEADKKLKKARTKQEQSDASKKVNNLYSILSKLTIENIRRGDANHETKSIN